MWWGYSKPLDLRSEIFEKGKDEEEKDDDDDLPLEFLIVGSTDARHIVKTLASGYKHSMKRRINFNVIEPFMEQVARSMLLLSTIIEDGLGIQEATRYFLELMGNSLIRPASAKYLLKRAKTLSDVATDSLNCPWIDLGKLKHRDRDTLDSIFKFWARATCEGIPIVEYWDRRIRKALGVRYDHRDGLFDWDYHMGIREREKSRLTLQEYKFWRKNGIAFTWIEGEPARSNPTLISDIVNHGEGYLHRCYMGDINIGPYFTWSLGKEEDKTEKLRATDIAEREIMRSIHEMKIKEPMCDEAPAAHRDSSLVNATIITEMPDDKIEQEIWGKDLLNKRKKVGKESAIVWSKEVEDFRVIFQPISSIDKYKERKDYFEKYHLVWIAHNMTKQLPNLVPLAKKGSTFIVESRKFIIDFRKDDIDKFSKELIEQASNCGLRLEGEFDSAKDDRAKFIKQNK